MPNNDFASGPTKLAVTSYKSTRLAAAAPNVVSAAPSRTSTRKGSQGGSKQASPSKIQTMSMDIKARQNRYNLDCDPSSQGLIEMRELEL